VPDQLEALVVEQVLDILAVAGEELSTQMTFGALASSLSQRCEPRNRSPPVIRMRDCDA